MNEKINLGYACVNMTLTNRPKKAGGRVTTSRTARKITWKKGSEDPKDWDLHLLGERALLNANDLLHYLQWNNEHKIKVFRLGSELFPWHDQYELHQLPQFNEIAKKLMECGNYARTNGIRVTTHPGPFNVLGSPKLDVVERTIISLERHSETFDLMGFDPSYENKINIHVGGSYGGDFEGTSARWIAGWHRLSDNCKKRVVLENDDKPSMWSVKMLYHYFHKEIGIPITFDYHHHSFHPDEMSEEQALKLAATTWPKDVRQCTHYSESRAREFNDPKIRAQAHSDYIVDKINTYDLELDIVIEAKAKELALLEYRNIYEYKNKRVLL
jgi:UV DNA damage endonuclease|tara:strand:- start:412 stop:1395 length:984 start_codon:yes stop_codon:yes gene_type:complete